MDGGIISIFVQARSATYFHSAVAAALRRGVRGKFELGHVVLGTTNKMGCHAFGSDGCLKSGLCRRHPIAGTLCCFS